LDNGGETGRMARDFRDGGKGVSSVDIVFVLPSP
jgi:hypothetical protein